MIILDTNVVSERFKPEPHKRVLHWLDSVGKTEVVITTMTIAEMWSGAADLDEGRKRTQLETLIDNMVEITFQGRIEDFDKAAAAVYGTVTRTRRDVGRPIQVPDAVIAAICIARRASLATRNIKDFEGLGITLINPWKD